jgi:predicted DNA-binding protein
MWHDGGVLMSKTAENPNIRISPRSKATLRELAEHDGRPMQNVLDEAIEQYRRDRFFRDLDEGYARLQADPKAWQEELDERRLWDATLADGLDSE